MSKTIEVDDILKGYNNYEKLRQIYKELRSEIFVQNPLQSSNQPLIYLTDPNYRGGSYSWEIHQQEKTICVIEAFGRWTGYAHESRSQPSLDQSNLNFLRITLHPPSSELERRINKIISRHPRESKKEAS